MNAGTPNDPSKSRLVVWVPIVVGVLVGLAGLVAWLYGRHDQFQSRIIAEERENQKLWCQLKGIQGRLANGLDTSRDLQTHYLEPGWGILESYVLKVRDGKESDSGLMHQRIESLVRNNEAIVASLQLYDADSLSSSFKIQSRAFVSHAENYSDRWRAVSSVIQTKNQLPYAVPFPNAFPDAIADEMRRRDVVSSSNREAMRQWLGQEDMFPSRNCSGHGT